MLNRLFCTTALLLLTADSAFATVSPPPDTIPEPSLLTLAASGVAGAILYARRRRQK